ncbi:G-protein coupled receptor GRL101 [Tetranychus urticae]|uniref:C-type lectin domain-containing protein n=1 Tax=Tetranychus urticae TaxID=32264 RepID=T1K8L1_TETUR|nr:G-protein coupled receptor GRL101 [Tetranychus urticae]XP_025016566.1 G-protein coupled receptor GRL101 [Tetranychus urticae]
MLQNQPKIVTIKCYKHERHKKCFNSIVNYLLLLLLILMALIDQVNGKLNCMVCGGHLDSCTLIDRCTGNCSDITSINYPSHYPNNYRCRWEIRADEGYYINLTINDFDVPGSETPGEGDKESCLFDHVSFFDSRFNRLIGRYCNSLLPGRYLVSPWNRLRIDFNTDIKGAGRGFNFTINIEKFTIDTELVPFLSAPPLACPVDWQFYKGHCYRAYKEYESLQWYKAEEKCSDVGKGRDGHLVSILDAKEMRVVHHFLTSVWHAEPHQSFYIGLIDVSKEGVYRWSDNNPMSYTDWAKGSGFQGVGDVTTAPQPDGGAYEDCTILKFASIHSTDGWHDVPCSLGKNSFPNLPSKLFEDVVDSYICKMDASAASFNVPPTREALYDDVIVPKEKIIRDLAVKEKYFVCANLEVISILQLCDGSATCRDGTDELDECPSSVGSNQKCLPFQFRCNNRRCISIALTCDFVDDCGDGSDEKNCYIRACKPSEFKCASGQCIPISQRCDLLFDCKDGSDENPSMCTSSGYCPSTTFQCYYGTCIPLYAVCDHHRDCPGKFHEDEQESSCYMMFNRSSVISSLTSSPPLSPYHHFFHSSSRGLTCASGQQIDQKFKCIYEFDQFGYQVGCRDVTHLRDCEKFECSIDYIKCPNSYCIPPRYICDGKRDCVGGEDETRCGSFVCPGQYKCINHPSCILLHQLCDGIRHCPGGDDEWFCNLTCPASCSCIGLYANCTWSNLTSLPRNLTLDIRKLDLTGNLLGPAMDSFEIDFSPYYHLVELILQSNGIKILRRRQFVDLKDLLVLDLRYNRIVVIESAAFAGLVRVNSLLLEGNTNLSEIEPRAFIGLSELKILNISGSHVRTLHANVFMGLTNLQNLEFRANRLEVVESGCFTGLTSVTILDLQGNDIKVFKKDMFNGLESLRYLYTNSFKFCCLVADKPFNIPFERCLPLPDEISDCEDLMSSPIQRYFLWILGSVALICNLSVIVWRFRSRLGSNKVSSSLILSLGCADVLMGLYMLIIASVDVYYRGRYIEVSDVWRTSYLCKFCGFLSTVSSEASVFTLVFIAIDRLICICFPFSKYRLTLRFTYKLIFSSWTLALAISTLPLLVNRYFQDQFYARSGVCLALHITNQKAAGWEYSFAVFVILNLLAFILILSCYIYMYKIILESSRRLSQVKSRQVRERQVGRQMALIVGSNFLCWFPIIVMGLLAINGYRLPATVYSWTAVFILPLNSATNPLVYTLAYFRPALFGNQRRDSLTNRLLTSKNTNSINQQKVIRPLKSPYGYMSLTNFLREMNNTEARFLLEISCSLSEQIKEIHEKGYALGGIDLDIIFVSSTVDSKYLRVYLPEYNAYKVTSTSETDDYALDIEEFGLLVKRMLRIYHFRRNLSFTGNNS